MSLAWALLHTLAYLTAAILLAFSLRRVVLLLAACPRALSWRGAAKGSAGTCLPSPTLPHSHTLSLLILIPCRNEAQSLPGLFAALDQLDYPRDQMRGVIVDDGSTDNTASVALSLASSRSWAQVVSLTQNVGKAQALNQALIPLPAGASPDEHYRRERGEGLGVGGEEEILVIYDADHRPSSASLRALVAPFTDSNVAAVSGQMRVVNGRASPAAFYTWVESHVNQFITMRGKDRLNLAPALLGANCAYRRSAFEAVGGFRPGALLEDSDLTLAFALAGWRTRFAPDSVSEHHAPTTLRGHVKQHLRWNRGFHQVMGGRLSALWASPMLSLWLKVELTFFALGYTDRLALLAGALFTAIDVLRPGTFGFPSWAWLIYFGLPALEMVAALVIAREPFGMFARLIYVPFFFILDIGIALWSSVLTIARWPFRWTMTERPQVS